ncbi:MAG: nuclear transport factor 2 family protein [Bacteroidetes bacterium]|nr:nuclear transport factor 2 family protein [Bacteroidota bacterium]MBS1930202.1 nuclear transport factor 2 family protein [Bacteroidota bacterium]
MEGNSALIEKFYTAFQKLDYAVMNSCYSDDIVFSDPVFILLKNDEVRSMWEMLCKNAKNFSLNYSNIQAVDEEYYTCNWTATYIFSKTGRKVVNHIKAFMRIKNGKIIEHSDAFRLSTWISQALGWKGVLFGWTNFMKRKVQRAARKSLNHFMERKTEG